MSSPAWSILTQCVAQAKTLDLTGDNGSPGIIDERIHAVTVPYSRDNRQRFAITGRPALVFCGPRSVEAPAASGDNCTYRAFYTVTAQILHTEFSQNVVGTVTKNIFKWEYTLRRYFHMGNLRLDADSTGAWYVTLAPVQKVDLADERLFHIFDDAVAIIPITFKVLEEHSSTGRL